MRTTILVLVCLFGLGSTSVGQDTPPATAQREFTEPTPLLNPDGSLAAWGWARRALMQYNREAIPANRQARIKEWDHYTIMSPEFTVGVTLVQLGPLVSGSAEVIDYAAGTIRSTQFIRPTPVSKAILPADPYGTTRLEQGDDFVALGFADGRRQIEFRIAKKGPAPALEGKVELMADPEHDSVAISRPFAGEGEFFYENKIFGLPASGAVSVDDQTYTLPADKSWAIFDWGRGLWPHESQWFWGQAAGRVGDRQVAWNLGHGYGDDAHGTCNAILVDGRLHKLDVVDCRFNADDRMQPWQFTSNDHRLTLEFRPIYNQHSKTDLGLISAELYKIHGYYSGTLVLDDGTKLEVKDVLGFAEHMKQRW
ncbi:MAG: DUF2804 domain-containing protein [Pirellulales bacterium]|nr:DUF2804 domain-containing protein [Pirellulales bacterium]